jgi:hypothetical protein
MPQLGLVVIVGGMPQLGLAPVVSG